MLNPMAAAAAAAAARHNVREKEAFLSFFVQYRLHLQNSRISFSFSL